MSAAARAASPRLVRFLSCQGDSHEVRGYELCGTRVASAEDARSAIAWLQRHWPAAAGFVVIDALPGLGAGAVEALARCAADAGLLDRIAVACVDAEAETAGTIEACRRRGLKVVLDRVGPRTRFGDLLRHPVHAVRLEPDFLNQSEGDPAASSVLDGIVCVAHNMGLTTIATGVSRRQTAHFLPAAGIDYAAVA